MELHEFRESVMEEVRINAVTELTSEKEEFLRIFTATLIEAEELCDFVFLPFEGLGKNRRRIQIDGYAYDDLDNCLSIFICSGISYPDEVSLTSSEAEILFFRIRAFMENTEYLLKNAEESSPGYGFAIDLENKYKNVAKYNFYILTDKTMSKSIREIKSDTLLDKPVFYNIWDITRWYELHESKTGKEEIIINLKEFTENGLPCLFASRTDDYTAYLCNIPGKILGDLYNTYGGKLLEGNVRSFLTVRRKVNKGIRNTILNDPGMFFAYNNGIAATAYDVKVEYTNGLYFLIEVTALQIVNGGQTTASLAMALINDRNRANDLKNIYVPMKLSVVTPEKAQELIPNIAKYANSQNQVSNADFFSNHTFHIRIEGFSRKTIAPAMNGNQYGTHWYYERTNGQYDQEQAKMTVAQRKKFQLSNPKQQKFTKTDLAKYVNIYRAVPHIVSLGAQKNFMKFAEWAEAEWSKKDTQFNEGFYRMVVALKIGFDKTDKLVKVQPWYESGYKAAIVTYTLSKLFYTIREDYPDKSFPFKRIWQQQAISKIMEEQIISLAEAIYYFLIDPEREVENVTEWAKRELCWKRAMEMEIVLMPGFVKELVDKDETEEEKKSDIKEQVFTNKANQMVEVANYGVEKWRYLIKWGQSNKVLNPSEIEIISTTLSMEEGKFPSEKNCIRILEILKKAREESFPA